MSGIADAEVKWENGCEYALLPYYSNADINEVRWQRVGLSPAAREDERALWQTVLDGEDTRRAAERLGIPPRRADYICDKWPFWEGRSDVSGWVDTPEREWLRSQGRMMQHPSETASWHDRRGQLSHDEMWITKHADIHLDDIQSRPPGQWLIDVRRRGDRIAAWCGIGDRVTHGPAERVHVEPPFDIVYTSAFVAEEADL